MLTFWSAVTLWSFIAVKEASARINDMSISCTRERTFCMGVKDNTVFLNNPFNNQGINDGGCISDRDCDILLVAFKEDEDYFWHLTAINNNLFNSTLNLYSVYIDDHKRVSAVMKRVFDTSSNGSR